MFRYHIKIVLVNLIYMEIISVGLLRQYNSHISGYRIFSSIKNHTFMQYGLMSLNNFHLKFLQSIQGLVWEENHHLVILGCIFYMITRVLVYFCLLSPVFFYFDEKWQQIILNKRCSILWTQNIGLKFAVNVEMEARRCA